MTKLVAKNTVWSICYLIAYFRFAVSKISLALLFMVPVTSHALVILQYHHISAHTPNVTSISPAQFAQHLTLIEQSGYEVVSIEHVASQLRAGKPLKDNTLVISFDDGYASIYKHALPLLKQRDWPFVVFVNTQPHDQGLSSYMSWQQLSELTAHRATIANHGVAHTHLLRRIDDPDARDIFKTEIVAAENKIKIKTGKSHKLFAYPYGEYDEAIAARLKENGYLAFGQNSGPVANDVDLQRIPRFPFGGIYGDEQDFLIKLHTLPMAGVKQRTLDEHGKEIASPYIPAYVQRPLWEIQLPDALADISLNCFASGQGATKLDRIGRKVIVQSKQALAAGRSKYNCTARALSGRYYWISTLWIKQSEDGTWLHD